MAGFDGKVVVITGGSGGLGRTYCYGFARKGARVVVADIAAGQVAADLRDQGADAIDVVVDVADVASTNAMASRVLEEFGRIDVLVNNAAYYIAAQRGRHDEITIDDWDTCFAVNVRGTWLCTRAVVPTMRALGGGRIVNVSSMTVVDGTVGFPHYVASKAAVIGLTRTLARELGPFGIAVNTVTPDYVPHNKEYSDLRPEVDEFSTGRRCFKRTETPEDLLGTVLFLSSNEVFSLTFS